MATFSITITIPDDKIDELKTVLDLDYPVEDGVTRDNEAYRMLLGQMLVYHLQQKYFRWKRRQSTPDLGGSSS